MMHMTLCRKTQYWTLETPQTWINQVELLAEEEEEEEAAVKRKNQEEMIYFQLDLGADDEMRTGHRSSPMIAAVDVTRVALT